MKKISRRMLFWLLASVIAALLIWFVGPALAFYNDSPFASIFTRVCLILGIFLIWACCCFKPHLMLQHFFKMQALQHEEKVKTQINRETKRKIKLAFKKMKALLLRQGDLYDLPWYLVMGEESAGKTQFIREAELHFAYQSYNDPDQKNGLFQWSLTHEAVFFDLSTELCQHTTTQQRLHWQLFLTFLKKARRRRPVNGVLLLLSLRDVLEGELQTWQEALRIRLHELQQKLGLKLPIYIVLTGVESIVGFSELTLGFTEQQRQQVFGIGIHAPYTEFIRSLNAYAWQKLDAEGSSSSNSKIYYFPMQLAALQQKMTVFIQDLLNAKPYFQGSNGRGIYFISHGPGAALQYDLILEESSLEGSPFPKTGKSRRYFSEGFLQQVLLREVELVGARYERQFKLWGHLKLGMIIVGTSALVLAWCLSTLKYESYNHQVLEALPGLNLSVLQTLYHTATDSEGSEWLHLGLWSQPSTFNVVSALYQQSLVRNFLPTILADLEQNLQATVSVVQQAQNNLTAVESLYQALSTYLMFNQLNQIQVPQITNRLDTEFAKQFSGNALLQNQEMTELQDLLDLGFPAQSLNQTLIQQARQMLWNSPVYIQAYLLLKLNALANPDTLSLTDDNFTGATVPLFFTRQGYNTIYAKQSQVSLDQVTNQAWVLGSGYHTQYSAADLSRFQNEMDQLYWSDYLNAWDAALANLNVVAFNSLQQAADAIGVLAKPDSPMISLLGEILKNSDYGPENLVTNHNLALSNLLAPVDGKAPPIQEILTSLGAVQQYVTSIEDSSNPNLAAYTAASAIFAGQADASLTTLSAEASMAPPPVSRWLNQIVANTEAVIFAAANQYLSQAWQANVSVYYEQTLVGRFPFTPSDSEVSLQDFSNFFKPGGVEDSFVKKYLSPFLTVTPFGQEAWSVINGIAFSPDNAIPLEVTQAAAIRNTFFGSSDAALNFSVSPVAVKGVSKAFFAYDGKNLTITNDVGPGIAMSWPPQNTDGTVSVTFHRMLLADETQNYPGPWGLFRLLQAARLVRSQYGNQYQVTLNDGSMAAVFSLSASSMENPFDLRLLRSYVCPDHFKEDSL